MGNSFRFGRATWQNLELQHRDSFTPLAAASTVAAAAADTPHKHTQRQSKRKPAQLSASGLRRCVTKWRSTEVLCVCFPSAGCVYAEKYAAISGNIRKFMSRENIIDYDALYIELVFTRATLDIDNVIN